MRSLHAAGRSSVYSSNGMCATSHPLAAEAAIACLRSGGNAVDAAVTASAVLCVVEPMSTGIGGDCFVLMSKNGSGDLIGLNGSGRAPKTLNANWLLAQGAEKIKLSSVHSVTVPGAIDAWISLLEAHGSMDIAQVLAPAIRFAEEGFPVSPRVAHDWDLLSRRLAKDADSAVHYLVDGRAPLVGERFRSPALAQTLKVVAREGRGGFYAGPVAEDMISKLSQLGGRHTLEDFAATKATWVTPLTSAYRGHAVAELPPNGQGVTAQLILNILSHFDLSTLDPLGPERFHLQAEASRLAYEQRDRWVADPSFSDIEEDKLLSADLARELAARIDPETALADVAEAAGPVYRDTVYLSVVDRDRTAVSFINSLYFGFGSGICSPASGVMFQNRGAGFVLEEGHPNRLEGGKRPLHTIIPGMLIQDGKPVMPFGVMGGAYQPVGHAHVLENMIDHGMDVQEAIDCPRAFHVSGKLEVEEGVPEATRAGLAARGHEVGDAFMPWGGGQAVMIDWKNDALIGGSDPRKDGCAIGY